MDFIFEPLLHYLSVGSATVVRHHYRTKAASRRFISTPYHHGDMWDQLRTELARAAKARPDNHEVYEVIMADGLESDRVYFQFSDWQCYVGLGLCPF